MEKVEELTVDEDVLEIISKEEDDKKNTKDRESYAYNSGKKDGVQEGIEQGEKQAKITVIKNLAKMKMKIIDIAESVDISVEEVEEILNGQDII